MVDKSIYKTQGKQPDEIKGIYKKYLNEELNQHGTNYENLTSHPLPNVVENVLKVDTSFACAESSSDFCSIFASRTVKKNFLASPVKT